MSNFPPISRRLWESSLGRIVSNFPSISREAYGEATGSRGNVTRRLRRGDEKARKEERGERRRGDRREEERGEKRREETGEKKREERGEDFGFKPFLTKKVGSHGPP